jgi:hypothetical protein
LSQTRNSNKTYKFETLPIQPHQSLPQPVTKFLVPDPFSFLTSRADSFFPNLFLSASAQPVPSPPLLLSLLLSPSNSALGLAPLHRPHPVAPPQPRPILAGQPCDTCGAAPTSDRCSVTRLSSPRTPRPIPLQPSLPTTTAASVVARHCSTSGQGPPHVP